MIRTLSEKKHEEQSALIGITPSGQFLNQLIDKFALNIIADLIDKMFMQRVVIANAISEVAHNEPSLSPLVLVLIHGKTHAQYRMLKRHKLVNL
tara:strand:+ start:296 stop:577 length:282 start_codon:yes stop_codon:yes gene_type:complete